MYTDKLILSIILVLPLMVFSQIQTVSDSDMISPQEIQHLIGEWEGTLMYLDYSSGKPFNMPANLRVEKGDNKYTLKFYNIYPNEPKANGENNLVISKNGRLINGKPLVSKKINSNDEFEYIVEYSGKDGNEDKKARIRERYIF